MPRTLQNTWRGVYMSHWVQHEYQHLKLWAKPIHIWVFCLKFTTKWETITLSCVVYGFIMSLKGSSDCFIIQFSPIASILWYMDSQNSTSDISKILLYLFLDVEKYEKLSKVIEKDLSGTSVVRGVHCKWVMRGIPL